MCAKTREKKKRTERTEEAAVLLPALDQVLAYVCDVVHEDRCILGSVDERLRSQIQFCFLLFFLEKSFFVPCPARSIDNNHWAHLCAARQARDDI